MEKKSILAVFILFVCSFGKAQNIGIGTSTPHASAILDINHSSKGLLIPRMSSQQILNIHQPAKSLMVYDSSANQLMVNKGTSASPNWLPIGGSSSGWSLNGNTGTNSEAHFQSPLF